MSCFPFITPAAKCRNVFLLNKCPSVLPHHEYVLLNFPQEYHRYNKFIGSECIYFIDKGKI